MIKEQTARSVINSKTPLQFVLPKDTFGPVWDRYLTINGKNILNIGNSCGTCQCYFKYLPRDKKANIAIAKEFSTRLNEGIGCLDKKLLEQAEMLIPDGDYFVLLSIVKPKIVALEGKNSYFSDEDNTYWYYSKTPYNLYNLQKKIAYTPKKELLIELLVPIVLPEKLNNERIIFYQEQLKKDIIPTAFSVALWDKKNSILEEYHPKYDPDLEQHNFIAHYIIDGHHKIHAAALLDRDIALLTYIRKNNYINDCVTQEEIDLLSQKEYAV